MVTAKHFSEKGLVYNVSLAVRTTTSACTYIYVFASHDKILICSPAVSFADRRIARALASQKHLIEDGTGLNNMYTRLSTIHV